MNTDSQQVLKNAMALPESERAEIAASLIHSLDSQDDDDVDTVRAIRAGMAAHERGEGVPFKQAFKDIAKIVKFLTKFQATTALSCCGIKLCVGRIVVITLREMQQHHAERDDYIRLRPKAALGKTIRTRIHALH